MARYKQIAISLCITLLASAIIVPQTARGSSRSDEDKPVRLYATAMNGPIGALQAGSISPGDLLINGRAASTSQGVWGGDLLEARGDGNILVRLDLVGEVRLKKGAILRLAVRRGATEAGEHHTLIASLLAGEIHARFQNSADAMLQLAGSLYTASAGAQWVASVSEGRALVTAKVGSVGREASPQHQYEIRPVGHGTGMRVKAGDLQQIRVQVIEDGKPVSDVGVNFVLDATGVGRLGLGTLAGNNITVVTNAEGIAAVPFTAGNRSGTTSVSATVEGTRTSWTGLIQVTSEGGVSHAAAWTIAIIAGAGAAAGIAYAVTRSKDSIQAPPPIIKQP